MANTFLHAQGVFVGASLHEPDLAADARRIMAEAEGAGCEIVLPTDVAGDAGVQGRRRGYGDAC